MRHVFEQVYTFDTLGDYNRDIVEAINQTQLDTDEYGVFEGSFKIQILYDEQRETLGDWDE